MQPSSFLRAKLIFRTRRNVSLGVGREYKGEKFCGKHGGRTIKARQTLHATTSSSYSARIPIYQSVSSLPHVFTLTPLHTSVSIRHQPRRY